MPHDPNSCITGDELLALKTVFQTPPFTTGFQSWTLTVTGVVSGPYIATANQVPYPFVATGAETIEVLRDAWIGVMAAGAHPEWLETPSSTDAIVLTSLQDGLKLDVNSNLGPTGSEVTLVETTPLTATELVHQAITAAECLVCDWGCSTWDGCAAAAAHWLKMWGEGNSASTVGATGQIQSMTQGPFSVTFASQTMTSGTDGWWSSTPEGLHFLFLRKQQGPRPIRMVGGRHCHVGGSIFGNRLGMHAGHRGRGC